jgi:hypothetical protein
VIGVSQFDRRGITAARAPLMLWGKGLWESKSEKFAPIGEGRRLSGGNVSGRGVAPAGPKVEPDQALRTADEVLTRRPPTGHFLKLRLRGS